VSDIQCPKHRCDLVPSNSAPDKKFCAQNSLEPLLKCPDAACRLKFSMQLAPETSGFFTFDGHGNPVLYWAKPDGGLPSPNYKPGE
jgi:hypothetical protein